jgi:chromosome segregation ATPase
VQEEARKAQERAEERERLEKKRDDCQTIVEDLEEQLQEAKDDLESVTDRLEELETEAD